MLRFWRRRREPLPTATPPTVPRCGESCPLAACPAGMCATVVGLGCAAHDATRLRALGVVEGSALGVVGVRRAIVLDVRGSRLAVDAAMARAITVRPLPDPVPA